MGTIDIIGSQLDIATIVSQMMLLERQPVYRMEDQVASMQGKVNAYQDFNTKLSALANTVNMMLYGTSYSPFVTSAPFNDRLARSMFATSTARSSNENVLTATAFGGGYTAQGSYSITVGKLATAQTSFSERVLDINQNIGEISGTISATATGGKSITIDVDKRQGTILTSGLVDDEEADLEDGTITIERNGAADINITIASISSGRSLKDVRDYINSHYSSGANGIEAKIEEVEGEDEDGGPKTSYRLIIANVDEKAGTANGFTITSDVPDLGFTQTQAAKDTTIRDLQQEINDKATAEGLGINALITNDGTGYRLMIVSKETGAANGFDGSLESTLPGPGTSLVFETRQRAEDAEFTLNGFEMTSSSNTLKSVIEGVTIELKNVTQGAETVKLDLGADEDAMVDSIKEVIAAYNEVVGFINSQFRHSINLVNTSNSSDFIKSQFKSTDVTSGVLAGDATLRSVQSQLQSIIMGSSIPREDSLKTFRSMGEIGIAVNDDGTLSLDESKLKKALSDDFEQTAKLFLGYEKIGDDGKTIVDNKGNPILYGGMLSKLGDALKGLTDPLRNPIKGAMDGLTSTINNVMRNIESYELRLQAKEDMLYAQFAAADQALRQMRVLLGSIGSSLASLSNMNNNN